MATKIKVQREAAVSFASAGTVVLTLTSLANAAGRVSAQWDRGAGALPGLYEWRVRTKAAAALAVGTVLELYLATSDGTTVDGNVGTADAALATTEKRRNLQVMGSIEADSTTNGEVQQGSGRVFITARYVSVVVWNALGQALSGTAGDHEVTLTPIVDEVQNPA